MSVWKHINSMRRRWNSTVIRRVCEWLRPGPFSSTKWACALCKSSSFYSHKEVWCLDSSNIEGGFPGVLLYSENQKKGSCCTRTNYTHYIPITKTTNTIVNNFKMFSNETKQSQNHCIFKLHRSPLSIYILANHTSSAPSHLSSPFLTIPKKQRKEHLSGKKILYCKSFCGQE